MASLKENTALVTGASSGVGKAIALELAALGMALLLVARSPHKLESVAQEIRRTNGAADVFAVDLTDEVSLALLGAELKRRVGRLDFLVHSAALFQRGPVATAPIAEFDVLYRCNVRAPYVLTQMLLPEIIATRGAIAFINSTAGERALANVSQYAATKHALKAVADSLRLENAAHGVRVLSVMLGRTATPMQEEVARLEGMPYEPSKFLQPRDVARAVVNALTLPPGAEVTDLHLRPAHI